MYERILVPLDGSRGAAAALGIAEQLADRWSTPIDVVSVVRRSEEAVARDLLLHAQVTDYAHIRNITVRPVVYTVADEIADEANAGADTIVVMSTSARSRAAGVLGSVAEKVLQFLAQPVLLVGPHIELLPDWPKSPMLVCVDGSVVAESIAPIAARWVRELDVNATVVSIDPSASAHDGEVESLDYLTGVARSIESAGPRRVEPVLLHGPDPAQAIVDHANAVGAGVVLISTRGRSGIGRLALGSVAMRVVHEASCPVLVNRP